MSDVFLIMGVGIIVILIVIGLWWVLKQALERLSLSSDPAFFSGVILFTLFFLFIIAMVIVGSGDDDGRCGPGTKRVVERIWTGKMFVTDFVCVVDFDVVER